MPDQIAREFIFGETSAKPREILGTCELSTSNLFLVAIVHPRGARLWLGQLEEYLAVFPSDIRLSLSRSL